MSFTEVTLLFDNITGFDSHTHQIPYLEFIPNDCCRISNTLEKLINDSTKHVWYYSLGISSVKIETRCFYFINGFITIYFQNKKDAVKFKLTCP